MDNTNKFLNKISLGDCLDLMPQLPEKSCDMILVDLPYQATSRNLWDIIIPFEPLWKEYERIIKDNGAIVLTATQPFATKLIASNYNLFRYDLIWEKPLATGFLNANRMPLRSHEHILVFYKSPPKYNPQKTPGKPYKMTRRSDTSNYGEVKNLHHVTENTTGDRHPKSIIRFSSDKDKLHPTQKPIELFKWLILSYTDAGEVVCDSCCGSGTTALACKELGRNYICFEKNEEYFKIACNRIGQINEN